MGPIFHEEDKIPSNHFIYVFGGNLAGKLVSPRAKIARNNFRVSYGTKDGLSERGYCIPVRDKALRVLGAAEVGAGVERFLAFARSKPQLQFFVTRVGCDEGELGDEIMARLFAASPPNCSMPSVWRALCCGTAGVQGTPTATLTAKVLTPA